MCQVKGFLPVTLPRNTLTLSVERAIARSKLSGELELHVTKARSPPIAVLTFGVKRPKFGTSIALGLVSEKKPVVNPGV